MMKKLKTSIMLVGLTFLFSCEYSGNYKYIIIDNRGEVYECNFYDENEDGCVMFNDEPGKNNEPGTPTILCGNYTIRKMK